MQNTNLVTVRDNVVTCNNRLVEVRSYVGKQHPVAELFDKLATGIEQLLEHVYDSPRAHFLRKNRYGKFTLTVNYVSSLDQHTGMSSTFHVRPVIAGKQILLRLVNGAASATDPGVESEPDCRLIANDQDIEEAVLLLASNLVRT